MYRFEIDDIVSRVLKIPDYFNLEQITSRLIEIAGLEDFSKGWAERISENMVTNVKTTNERHWRTAAAKSGQGARIYAALMKEQAGPVGAITRNLVAQSSLLIRTMPAEVALQANHFIANEQMRGRRAFDIAADLRKRLPEMKRSRLDLIARTQVTTTATAITEARSESLGIKGYQWLTSEDARVRKAHAKMDKVLVLWKYPPAPEALVGIRSTLGHYHAGMCPNCRCDPAPVVDLGEVSWPARVFDGTTIVRMSRKRFEAFAQAA